MEIGVSTASLFKRQYNEDALITLNEIDARVCEIFLKSNGRQYFLLRLNDKPWNKNA